MSSPSQQTDNQGSDAPPNSTTTDQQQQVATHYLPDLEKWIKDPETNPLLSVECPICHDPIGVADPNGVSLYAGESTSAAEKRKMTFGHVYHCNHIVCRMCSLHWLLNRLTFTCPYCRTHDPGQVSKRLQQVVDDMFRQHRG